MTDEIEDPFAEPTEDKIESTDLGMLAAEMMEDIESAYDSGYLGNVIIIAEVHTDDDSIMETYSSKSTTWEKIGMLRFVLASLEKRGVEIDP
jgi:RNA binding exosome subunit